MKRSPVIWFLCAVAAALILIFGLYSIVFSDSMIKGLIENSLKGSDLSVEITNLKKGIFFSLSSDRITLKKSGNVLLSIDNASGKINPLSLIMMRLTLHFDGVIGGGRMNGAINLFGGKNLTTIGISDAHIEEIPFFALIGLNGSGVLSGGLKLQNGSGETRVEIREARFKTGNFGGVTVPLEMFDGARGALTIGRSMLKVVSFSMEGRGIYARIKGNVAGGQTDLTMELMPEKTFSEHNPLLSLVESYKVSPGFYSIPIKSTLNF